MMGKIVSKLLPVDAVIEYVTDVLVAGGASKDSDIVFGAIYTLAPESATADELLDFVHGGVLPITQAISDGRTKIQSVPNTIGVAALILSKELMLCEKPKLWIHEPLLTEVELVARGLPYMKVGEAIYLVFEVGLDAKCVAELIRYSLLSWHFLAFVTESKNEINSVDELICAAKFLLVGAYDGESFLYTVRESQLYKLLK